MSVVHPTNTTGIRVQDPRAPPAGGNQPLVPTIPQVTPLPPPVLLLPPKPGSLRILSLNTYGLNAAEKRSNLIKEMAPLTPDLICFQETKLKTTCTFAQAQFKGKALWGSADNSGLGTAVIFPPNSKCSPDLSQSFSSPRLIIVPFTWDTSQFLLFNVYAPNDPPERSTFFQMVTEKIRDHPKRTFETKIILVGDFNCVSDLVQDKLIYNPNGHSFPQPLRDTIANEELVDTFRSLNPDLRDFTWTNNTLFSRIDYLFIPSILLPRTTQFVHKFTTLSDHKILIADLDPIKPRIFGKGYWMLNTLSLKDPKAIDLYKKVITETRIEDFDDPSKWLVALLARTKATAQKFAKEKAQAQQNHADSLRKRITTLEQSLTLNPTHPTLRLSLKATKKALHTLLSKKRQRNRLHSGATFLQLGERASKYFSAIGKTRAEKNVINSLRHPNGTLTEDNVEIGRIASEFYTDLYSQEITQLAPQTKLLEQLHRKLDEVQKTTLEAPIDLEEIKHAIKMSPKQKSPGIDGIPVEFWQKFPALAPSLVRLYNYWFQTGVIPECSQQGVVTLLYKKGPPENIKNYRPISLLTSVYKILTKILTNRVKMVMGNLISPAQMAAPQRYIATNIRTMSEALNYIKKNDLSGGALLLDQEKAFDKVDWHFMTEILRKMGFGHNFLKWISILYQDANSLLKINNTLSDPFKLQRGVRQGDPLSPLLYVLYLEPLICAIDRDQRIKGIELLDQSLKTLAFADDLTVFVASQEDIALTEEWMTLFENATGGSFNKEKSEAVLQNIPPPQNANFFPTFNLDPNYHFTYLGCPCSFNLNIERAWFPLIEKLKSTLEKWKKLNLSLTGRACVLRTYAHSLLTYQATNLALPAKLLSIVQDASWKFFWAGKGKKAKVNMETCKISKEFGGLGYPDFSDLSNSLHAKWIVRLLRSWNDSYPWVSLAKWSLSKVNEKWKHGLSSIATPGSYHNASEAHSSFWGAALEAFWKLEPHYAIDPDHPLCPILSKSLPLFNNPYILHHGHPLKQESWLKWVEAGITKVGDLIVNGHFTSLVELQAKIPFKLTQATFYKLMTAIPAQLKEFAQLPDPLPTPNPPVSLYPRFIMISDDVPALQARNCDLRRISVPNRTPKGEQAWTEVLSPPPRAAPHWSRGYQKLWKAPTPNKWKDLLFLLQKRSLYLGENAQKHNFDGIPHLCKRCYQLETNEHLFFHCPRARSVWRWVQRAWKSITGFNTPLPQLDSILLLSLPTKKTRSKELELVDSSLILAATAAIWRARCIEIFDEPHQSQPFPTSQTTSKTSSTTTH